jgi:hypothetical protein
VLLTVYSHCIHGHDDLLNWQIDHVLKPLSESGPCPSVETQRLGPTAQIPSAMRPWTPRRSGPQRHKVTHHGTEKKRPA